MEATAIEHNIITVLYKGEKKTIDIDTTYFELWLKDYDRLFKEVQGYSYFTEDITTTKEEITMTEYLEITESSVILEDFEKYMRKEKQRELILERADYY